jgi:hypothetical protein
MRKPTFSFYRISFLIPLIHYSKTRWRTNRRCEGFHRVPMTIYALRFIKYYEIRSVFHSETFNPQDVVSINGLVALSPATPEIFCVRVWVPGSPVRHGLSMGEEDGRWPPTLWPQGRFGGGLHAGHRRVGLGGPGWNFRESVDTHCRTGLVRGKLSVRILPFHLFWVLKVFFDWRFLEISEERS